jgi:hypothetical protein
VKPLAVAKSRPLCFGLASRLSISFRLKARPPSQLGIVRGEGRTAGASALPTLFTAILFTEQPARTTAKATAEPSSDGWGADSAREHLHRERLL